MDVFLPPSMRLHRGRYIGCLREATTDVALTLSLLSHEDVDLHFRKAAAGGSVEAMSTAVLPRLRSSRGESAW